MHLISHSMQPLWALNQILPETYLHAWAGRLGRDGIGVSAFHNHSLGSLYVKIRGSYTITMKMILLQVYMHGMLELITACMTLWSSLSCSIMCPDCRTIVLTSCHNSSLLAINFSCMLKNITRACWPSIKVFTGDWKNGMITDPSSDLLGGDYSSCTAATRYMVELILLW